MKHEISMNVNGQEVFKPVGYKPFDRESYKVNQPLELLVAAKLRIKGCQIVKNPDKFGIDLLIRKNGETVGGIEVEAYKRWSTRKWYGGVVHFLGRKAKYALPNCFYIIVGHKGVLMCEFVNIVSCKTVRVNTPVCDNEPMFAVPKVYCIFGWKRINNYLNGYVNGLKDSGYVSNLTGVNE